MSNEVEQQDADTAVEEQPSEQSVGDGTENNNEQKQGEETTANGDDGGSSQTALSSPNSYRGPVPLPPRKPSLLAHFSRRIVAAITLLFAIILVAAFLEPILTNFDTTFSLPTYLKIAGFVTSTNEITVTVRPKKFVPGPAARQTCVVLEADLSKYDLPNRQFLECWGGIDECQGPNSTTLREKHYTEKSEYGFQDYAIQHSNLARIDNARNIKFACDVFGLNTVDFEVVVATLARKLPVPFNGYPGVPEALYASELESCILMSSNLLACATTTEVPKGVAVYNFGERTPGNRSTVVDVALGTSYGCALVSERMVEEQDLAVYCWGELFEPDSRIDLGEPGEHTEITELRISGGEIAPENVTLVTTRNFACVFASTIECVGDAPNFGTRYESGLYDCGYVPGGGSKVTFGNDHVCITTGTSTKCFGVTRFGVLGGSTLSETVDYTEPNGQLLLVGVAELVDIVSYYRHNCAMFRSLEESNKDAKMWVQCWGSNVENQLGVEVTKAIERDLFSIYPDTVQTIQSIGMCEIFPDCAAHVPEFNELAEQVQLGVVAAAICILIVMLYWFTFQPYLRRRSAYKQYWKSRNVTKFVEDEGSDSRVADEDTTSEDKIEFREGNSSAERNGLVVDSSGKLDDTDVAEVLSRD